MTDLLLVLVLIGLTITIFLVLKAQKPANTDTFTMLQQQITGLSQVLDQKLSESNRSLQEQFRSSVDIIRNVTEKLTKLDETNRQVVGFAQQLQSLEDILQNTKQRGIFGEYYLEELLKNVFAPGQFQMQYKFSNGDLVDAAIFLKDGKIIPIDSKFPLENYNRLVEEKDAAKRVQYESLFRQDLKNRIDETAKYIRPGEKTLDFALMFIPSEALYYDLLVNKVGAIKSSARDMLDYAIRDKRVHIVSPTSFYAYLQTILYGLKLMQIEESAQEIRKNVEMLGRHMATYEEYMKKLGDHMATSVSSYNNAYKEFAKMDKDVVKITGAAKEPLEIKQINKPNNIE
ncbi:MAG TPA: DNA recombination protein RmuC [Candidatus Pacearchaeota archaeon]|mgnify:CR=1 FL=1|nr:DNA recombination protein RmuC [Candidatus Pacearchaeota archaeon]